MNPSVGGPMILGGRPGSRDVRRVSSPSVARLLFAAAGIVGAFVAFLRGNYLFGPDCGILYAAIAIALFWLLARSRTPAGGLSVVRGVFVLVLALPVGYAMAFPASINPDVQIVIDQQTTDRRARAELAVVFASDPAYRDLSTSSVHLKGVYITVRGALGTRADLDRLRSRIPGECPAFFGACTLHWDVILRDSGQRVDGLDRDLFEKADPGVAPDRGRKAGAGR